MRLAFDQRQFAEVVAVEMEQVEGDHHDLVGLAAQLVLKHRKIRAAIESRNHDFGFDDGGRGLQQEGIIGDLLEMFGPVVAAAGVDPDCLVRRATAPGSRRT
jgi:hypothetical protein